MMLATIKNFVCMFHFLIFVSSSSLCIFLVDFYIRVNFTYKETSSDITNGAADDTKRSAE